MSPQPSLKSALSYPVFGALPLVCSLARIVVAFGCPEASVATEANSIAVKLRTAINKLVASFFKDGFSLQYFNDLFDKGINLIFCIASPLGFESGEPYVPNTQSVASLEMS